MNYYSVTTGERRQIDPSIHSAWTAAGNPKAAEWLPIPEQPDHDPATHTCDWTGSDWALTPIPHPTHVVWPNSGAFLAAFTIEERGAIDLSDNVYVAGLRATLYTHQGQIWSNNELIQQGMALLVQTGILTQARAAEIVTPPGLL